MTLRCALYAWEQDTLRYAQHAVDDLYLEVPDASSARTERGGNHDFPH